MPISTSDKTMEWIAEADYIARVDVDMQAKGCSTEFNGSTALWARYCQMQYYSAMREGFYTIAQTIPHTDEN